MIQQNQKALVVLSGGQDSTTCLYWALQQFSSVITVTFDYGQRHLIELEAAQKVAEVAGVKMKSSPSTLSKCLGGNALTGDESVDPSNSEGELPNTFVPGRNLIF